MKIIEIENWMKLIYVFGTSETFSPLNCLGEVSGLHSSSPASSPIIWNISRYCLLENRFPRWSWINYCHIKQTQCSFWPSTVCLYWERSKGKNQLKVFLVQSSSRELRYFQCDDFNWSELWEMYPICLKSGTTDKRRLARFCCSRQVDVSALALRLAFWRSACIQAKIPQSLLLNRAVTLIGLPLKAAIGFLSRAEIPAGPATVNHICSTSVFLCRDC